ncbi:MAG: aminomethyl-transferring glycine dehydrogenase subunit GcvPA [Bryobacterales bacterium]|nr:aminomethyl-transferring glycine dehydrogenase subunit GcvPA [Bryobacterales bacterium]
MRYLPKSDSERQQMLAACGLQSLEDLVAHLPPEVLQQQALELPDGMSEFEIVDYFRQRGDRMANGYASFLGGGVYRHYRPVLADVVVQRGEFLTSYTPYQAEISQGTLVTIFEFQSMICQLTGMDVANASMYDGSTAVPEAALMAARVNKRSGILVARSVHPEYREVLTTTVRNQDLPVTEVAYDPRTGQIDLADLEAKLNDTISAVIVQSPNFFGVIENVKAAADLAHAHGALLIFTFTEAVSLGLLQPPAGADIVAGELQSFAISPCYGGPFAGVIATRMEHIRQLPGRIVGQTTDASGKRAFCLTLSTREQHIRREKATSNICTNQALIALMATVFMAVYGKVGLRELAHQNLSKAHYLADGLSRRFQAPFFNEFVLDCAAMGLTAEGLNQSLLDRKIIGGIPLGRFYPELEGSLLLCATEMNRREEMDVLRGALQAEPVLSSVNGTA